MNARTRIRMSFEDYLAWEARQEEKHELVDGYPVLRRILRGMSGGTMAHSYIAGNLREAIRARLPRGGPCRAMGSDFKVKSPSGNGHYPDVTIDCSASWGDLVAQAPTVVAEVLSPSNTDKDLETRRADYQAIPSVAHIAYVEQDHASIELWTRDGALWRRSLSQGERGVLELPAVGVSAPLAEIYADVLFERE
jgi:Uma2 family endonuclease